MEDMIDKAEIMGNMIARKIKRMGLEIAASKTEAIRFRRVGEKRGKEIGKIMIENTMISIGSSMNYLGIKLSDDWSIKNHIESAVSKAEIIANKLGKLMANKKGPREKKRRLPKCS